MRLKLAALTALLLAFSGTRARHHLMHHVHWDGTPEGK